MATAPRPYTPEWFAIMDDRNPQQAEMSREFRRLVGTDQCCMVCGDTRNVKDFMTDEEVAVRICGDCKTIQEQMYGAVHVPMD
ncbi:MAG: hypothetical protein JWO38_3009 [Gemmataceae bacterium]|nr:hypothetical protein [Gemmataceae bacterium]